jgi:hypothetical protein
MKICSKKNCYVVGEHARNGQKSSFYCNKHYRFIRMQAKAKEKNKYIPTDDELEILLFLCGKEKVCFSCNKKMQWHSKYKGLRHVISLQHNHNGTISFICHGCNGGHSRSHLGDQYFYIDKNKKYCPSCKKVLSRSKFNKSTYRYDGLRHECRQCQKIRNDIRRK